MAHALLGRHAMQAPDRLFRALVVAGASLTGGVIGCGNAAQPTDSPRADAGVDAQASHDAAATEDVNYGRIYAPCPNGTAPPCITILDAGVPPDGAGEDAGASFVDASGDGACGPCGANQVCVHPWDCGGNLLPCVAATDAAACPSAWTFEAHCGSVSSGPGCKPPPCVNPPPSCADVPPACSGTLTCGCLNSLCQSVCSTVQGRDVMCGGA